MKDVRDLKNLTIHNVHHISVQRSRAFRTRVYARLRRRTAHVVKCTCHEQATTVGRRSRTRSSHGTPKPTRWATPFSSKGNVHHTINFRVSCGANVVTRWSRSPQNRGEGNPRAPMCGSGDSWRGTSSVYGTGFGVHTAEEDSTIFFGPLDLY